MFTALQDLKPRDLKKNYKNKKIKEAPGEATT